jgi:hypothetical protein
MGESVGDSPCRHSNIEHRDCPLQPMMAGPVKQVAQTDAGNIFSGKIERESSSVAVENADDGIQFAPATLQVLVGDGEICHGQRCGCGKQGDVRLVPEPVFTCLGQRRRRRFHKRRGRFKSRLRCIEGECLREYGRASDASGDEAEENQAEQKREMEQSHRVRAQAARHLARRKPNATCPTLELTETFRNQSLNTRPAFEYPGYCALCCRFTA